MLKLILILLIHHASPQKTKVSLDSNDPASLSCLESKSHKVQPSPECLLKDECKSWHALSCCNNATVEILHADNNYWYDFNYDHCYRLSPKCRRRFRQELCFYECDPYLGIWIVKVIIFDCEKCLNFYNSNIFEPRTSQRRCESNDSIKYLCAKKTVKTGLMIVVMTIHVVIIGIKGLFGKPRRTMEHVCKIETKFK